VTKTCLITEVSNISISCENVWHWHFALGMFHDFSKNALLVTLEQDAGHLSIR